MAKPSNVGSRSAPIVVGRPAPAEVWSPSYLMAALKKPSPARKQQLLREAGILDAAGKLSKMYRSGGNRVSRASFVTRSR